MQRLPRSFFERYTPLVAKELLGARMVRIDKGRRLAGFIVETEAYRGSSDPASHASKGMTRRNEVMFGPAGHAYVYFTMGTHFCLNVTTEGEGVPGAVLVRAIQPLEGVDEMKRKRGTVAASRLASGPGNVARALGIDLGQNGEDMVTSKKLFLERGRAVPRIGTSARVGISGGISFKWRFYAEGSPFVSRGKPAAPSGKP